jgi:hypothetical protein
LAVGASSSASANTTARVSSKPARSVDGLGAIVNTSGRDQYNALSKLALAGDTAFGGTARWDLRNSSATLDMNSFNITKTGTNYVGLTSVLVNPGTGSVDVAQGAFTLESATTLNGSATNRLTVRTGASLDMNSLAAAPAWSLTFENGATFNSRAGWHPLNTWSGPVTLNGTASLTGVSGTSETLSGPISGSGTLVKNGAGTTAYLTSDAKPTPGTRSSATAPSSPTIRARFPGTPRPGACLWRPTPTSPSAPATARPAGVRRRSTPCVRAARLPLARLFWRSTRRWETPSAAAVSATL